MSENGGETRLRRSGYMRIVQVFLILLIQASIFFLSAGRADIIRAWFYFSLGAINLSLNFFIFYWLAPEIINQRGEIKKGTKRWDKVFSALYAPFFLLLPAIAGFDMGRYEWSSLGIGYAIAGVLLYLISAIFLDWAMITNTHFETTVRIQKDRGHKVASDGPYGVVRHPGYVALILSAPSLPLIIGSAYAMIPAVIMMLLLSIRTYFEDKTLQLELDGYIDYAKKVKYRLLPGVW